MISRSLRLSSLHASNFLDDCEICYDFKSGWTSLIGKRKLYYHQWSLQTWLAGEFTSKFPSAVCVCVFSLDDREVCDPSKPAAYHIDLVTRLFQAQNQRSVVKKKQRSVPTATGMHTEHRRIYHESIFNNFSINIIFQQVINRNIPISLSSLLRLLLDSSVVFAIFQ